MTIDRMVYIFTQFVHIKKLKFYLIRKRKKEKKVKILILPNGLIA